MTGDDHGWDDDDEPNPEDFQPTLREKGYLERLPDVGSFIVALAIYALCFAVSMGAWGSGTDLSASYQTVIVEKRYWRLLSALFVHGDLEHLLANGPLLLVFGCFLRFFFGLFAFPFLALLLGALANLLTIYYYDPQMRVVGASGMLYAMVSLWIALYLRFDTMHTVWVRLFRAIGFSAILLFPTTFRDEVSYVSHGVGFVLGLVGAVVFLPKLQASVDGFKSDGTHHQ
ncbi:MAG: rhomboid family intramembrane serine protease [Deltaproteobacteria bacterium]|nr:rhomboid family intramembrane serine protease [Deltaproteobacteria bacterium]